MFPRTAPAAAATSQRWLDTIHTVSHDATRNLAGAVLGLGRNGAESLDPLLPIVSRRAGELAMVEELLAERPELGLALVQEARAASEVEGNGAAAAMTALAEMRAAIVTEARLRYLHQEAPKAIAAYRDDLARYLDTMERSGAPTREAPEPEEPAEWHAETVTYGSGNAAPTRRRANAGDA